MGEDFAKRAHHAIEIGPIQIITMQPLAHYAAGFQPRPGQLKRFLVKRFPTPASQGSMVIGDQVISPAGEQQMIAPVIDDQLEFWRL